MDSDVESVCSLGDSDAAVTAMDTFFQTDEEYCDSENSSTRPTGEEYCHTEYSRTSPTDEAPHDPGSENLRQLVSVMDFSQSEEEKMNTENFSDSNLDETMTSQDSIYSDVTNVPSVDGHTTSEELLSDHHSEPFQGTSGESKTRALIERPINLSTDNDGSLVTDECLSFHYKTQAVDSCKMSKGSTDTSDKDSDIIAISSDESEGEMNVDWASDLKSKEQKENLDILDSLFESTQTTSPKNSETCRRLSQLSNPTTPAPHGEIISAVMVKDAGLKAGARQSSSSSITVTEGVSSKSEEEEQVQFASGQGSLTEALGQHCHNNKGSVDTPPFQDKLQQEPSSAARVEANDMDFFGLGKKVKEAVFSTFDIQKLHPWQTDMLIKHIFENNEQKHGLLLAPTSGGKTLVAVIIMLRSMLVHKKDVIMALPYVAIVTEKINELRVLANKLNTFSVLEYASSKGHFPIPKQKKCLQRIYVASFEKACGIWRYLCKENERRYEIGTVVIDELQMLSQGMRGAVLEGLIVSLMSMSGGAVNLVALTATVGNPEELRLFLGCGDPAKCVLHEVNIRPIKIKEHIVVSGSCVPILRGPDGKGMVDFETKARRVFEDKDRLVDEELTMFVSYKDRLIAKLVFEAIDSNRSVLVFCSKRKEALDLCSTLTKARKALYSHSDDLKQEKKNLVGHLLQESKGMVDSVLLEGIKARMGFHTAALHPMERKAIEDAFSEGLILALSCTSTLAAGVNLPASRVIIASPYTWNGNDLITCSSYLQQVGRAGRGVRRGLGDDCSIADSYIFVDAETMPRFEVLLSKPVESIQSQLSNATAYYKRTAAHEQPCSPLDGQYPFSGTTRLILTALEMGSSSGVCMDQIISLYCHTLLYQQGTIIPETGTRIWTLSPLLDEIVKLLNTNYIQVAWPGEGMNEVDITVTVSTRSGLQPPSQTPKKLIGLVSDDVLGENVSAADLEDFVRSLKSESEDGKVTIKNYTLMTTQFTAAATAGFMSLDDAYNFVQEADLLQKVMCIESMLTILYLSITLEMSRRITDTGRSLVQETTTLIDKEIHRNTFLSSSHRRRGRIAAKYQSHPHRPLFENVGLTEQHLNMWVRGSARVRKDEVFTNKLTRMWSALFMNDLCCHPDKYEELCRKYGFDRGMALELASNLSNRCHNIRVFCLIMEKYWWYPPLSAKIETDLIDAAKEELRPLLVIRHVTPERAKVMMKMGLHNVRDVAMVKPPTKLSDTIQFLGSLQALEMVADARILLSNEVVELAAESRDRAEALESSTNSDCCL